MARPETASVMPHGDISIGHTFALGGCPYNQPLPDGLFLNYSNDRRTFKNYKVLHTKPYIENTVPHFEIEELPIKQQTVHRNALLWNTGSRDFNTVMSQTQAPRTDGDHWTNWGGDRATWMPIDSAPVSGLYPLIAPVTDFDVFKIALYPYVQVDYVDGGIQQRSSKIGLSNYFIDGDRPTYTGTYKGLYFGYDLLYSNNSDGQGSASATGVGKAFFLGGIVENDDMVVKTLDRYNEIVDTTVDKSYQFTYTNQTLLGSTTAYNAGRGGRFWGFVGDTDHLWIEYPTPAYWDDSNKTVITTQGYGYEDVLAAALARGITVIEDSGTATEFTSFEAGVFWSEKVNDHVINPVLTEDGTQVTNEFVRGRKILDTSDPKAKKTPIQKWNDKNPYDETPEFDPTDPDDVDPNQYTDETPLNEVPSFMNPIGKFNRYFALSSEDIGELAAFLSPSADNVWEDILNGLKLYGEDPMNFMLELMAFPFDITKYTGQQAQEITFGRRINTGITADIIHDASITIDLGTCYFRRYHKNFLDYEPYTTAKLYIPYCNEVTIPTSVYLGHYINVQMIIDLSTGGCTAVIFKKDTPDPNVKGIAALYTQGQIGVPIPMTAINATEYIKGCWDMINGAFNSISQIAANGGALHPTSMTTGTSGQGVSPLTGKAVEGTGSKTKTTIQSSKVSGQGIFGGVVSGLQVAYEFNTMATPLETSGSGIPYSNFFKPQYCYFVVQSAVPMNVQGYGNTIGYAKLEYRKLNDSDNYIVAHNPNVQPENATSQETQEINALLATGVWR